MVANRAYYSLNKFFRSTLISKTCKLTLYKITIRPILCYNAETWTLTTTNKNRLRIFKRKVLRKIFGPVKVKDESTRIRFNHELLQLVEGEDVVKFIKAQRLRWAGHLERKRRV